MSSLLACDPTCGLDWAFRDDVDVNKPMMIESSNSGKSDAFVYTKTSDGESVTVNAKMLLEERDFAFKRLRAAEEEIRMLKKYNMAAMRRIHQLHNDKRGAQNALEGQFEEPDMLDRVFDW